jgi:hypothetical protein
MIVTYELKRIWKEAAVTYFKILSQNLLGGTEEKYEGGLSSGRDLNVGPP